MNIAKLTNQNHKSNIPFSQRIKIAKSTFIEPQKLAYRKEQELTPFEQFEMQNESDYRSRWADASDFFEGHDDRHFDYMSIED